MTAGRNSVKDKLSNSRILTDPNVAQARDFSYDAYDDGFSLRSKSPLPKG